MDAIYSNGRSVEATDRYYNDFSAFMGVLTYGRPGGERWPKLNLLEMTGVIKKVADELLYLEKVLPHWERTFSKDYRVELLLNDEVHRVLHPGTGRGPARLLFHFVDSADLLTEGGLVSHGW